MIINEIPLNPAALEAAAKAIDPGLYGDFEADLVKHAGFSEEKAREYVIAKKTRTEDFARAAVSAYLSERSYLMSGPRFSTEELRKLRGIVESGTPLARNTVLRLIESAFIEVTK